MTKVKEYTCGYAHCHHNGEKVPSDKAIKDGTRYYHDDCFNEKAQKQQVTDIYYKYYKSTEQKTVVNGAIHQLINSGFSSNYVLYVLCYAIKKKIPFKSIYTLSYLVKNDLQVKKLYDKYMARKAIANFVFDGVNISEEKITTCQTTTKGNWETTLFS